MHAARTQARAQDADQKEQLSTRWAAVLELTGEIVGDEGTVTLPPLTTTAIDAGGVPANTTLAALRAEVALLERVLGEVERDASG